MKLANKNNLIIPTPGLGTAGILGWQNDGPEVVEIITFALNCGYRHIDSAPIYGNQRSIGRAIINSGIERQDLFVTTKIGIHDMGYDLALDAAKNNLKRFQLDYLDMILIHWPVPGKTESTWRALEHLVGNKLVRGIGVSNFDQSELSSLLAYAKIKPTCNQIEIHPYCAQPALRQYCQAQEIQIISSSPLGVGQWKDITDDQRPYNDPAIKMLAEKYGVSQSLIILRWHYQNDVIPIPKSGSVNHIKQNLELTGFELSREDMKIINHLDRDLHFSVAPDFASL